MIENRWKKMVSRIAVSCVALAIIYPVIMMVMISLKSDADYITNPFGFSKQIQWENYRTAFVGTNYMTAFKNSMVLTAFAAGGGTVLSAITAYAIERAPRGRRFFGKIGLFFWLGLALPQQVIMVPLVLWMKTLGLGGTLLGLILVYIAVNAAYGVFFFSGFVHSVPIELEEAARIDGASPFITLIRIALPILKTPMVTLAIIMILRVYNNFMLPLILVQGKEARTLPLTIYFFKGDNSIQWNVMFAAATLVVLPLMVIYFLFQKRIVDGMLSGSVKM